MNTKRHILAACISLCVDIRSIVRIELTRVLIAHIRATIRTAAQGVFSADHIRYGRRQLKALCDEARPGFTILDEFQSTSRVNVLNHALCNMRSIRHYDCDTIEYQFSHAERWSDDINLQILWRFITDTDDSFYDETIRMVYDDGGLYNMYFEG